MLLRPGQPLGYSARIESQQRLAALGLFRRVAIEELRHAGEPRRDVLIQVEEAPPTTIGYGGGVEGGTRLRPTGEGGQAEERFEFAPRGFFEIGRRNLWGKNRAVNLFGRVSLRSRDIVLSESGIRFDQPAEGSGYGFNEYRVLATFREPKVLNTPADVLVTGILDQAIRSSFNFITREARAEAGVRVGPLYSLAGRYSYEHTRLFDERFTEAEKPLIDRIFPQVRISKFSASLIRDTRNDVLDPDSGTLAILDSQLAARMIGSEVGFTRTFVEGFAFYRVARRTACSCWHLARESVSRTGFAARCRASARTVSPVTMPAALPIVDVVEDLLPASERFFAGGDTTVRGLLAGSARHPGDNQLDRLSHRRERLGGAERRDACGARRAVSVLSGSSMPATSFFAPGIWTWDSCAVPRDSGSGYRSPVGPIRIDMGFKLDRRELAPGRLERSNVLHISLGQAFYVIARRDDVSLRYAAVFVSSGSRLLNAAAAAGPHRRSRRRQPDYAHRCEGQPSRSASPTSLPVPHETAAIEPLIDRQLMLAEVERFAPPEPRRPTSLVR